MAEMHSKSMPVIAAIAVSLSTLTYSQQPVSLEQRISELEKRVAKLEARAGASAVPEAARQTRVTQTASTASQTYSTRIPLELKLVFKKTEKSSEAGKPDELRFHVQFKNTGSKDITGIEGDLVVKNISAKPLLEFGMSTSKYIAAGDSLMWPCAVDYDPKEEGHRTVSQSDKNYLVIELVPEKITYSDGTADVYKKQE